jgi:hypothetical protein
LLEFGLELRTTLEHVVLRAEALLEFLSCSVEHGRAEAGRGQVWAGELGTVLILSNVVEAMIDSPIHHAESLVQNELDPVLEEAEGEVD